MATKQQIDGARSMLAAKWDSEGACGSCGWHGLLSEHDVDDCDIADALDGDGILRLGCVTKNDEERWGHRGVKICIKTNASGEEISAAKFRVLQAESALAKAHAAVVSAEVDLRCAEQRLAMLLPNVSGEQQPGNSNCKQSQCDE